MFDSRYEVVLADTPESKEIHFNLRYRVFCLEKKFEDETKFSHEMEKDQYDERAVHFLVRDRLKREWIGAARLIIGKLDTLPISKVAEIDDLRIENSTIVAEFSRLLVLQKFRRSHANVAASTAEPEILLGLIRATKDYCFQQNITNVLFLCRRSIFRILGNAGIEMQQIGSPCLYRGVRVPYLINSKGFDKLSFSHSRTRQMFSKSPTYFCYSGIYDRQVA
jgi:N-acyl amino acid synthase of PEP-CTERM/exosortase system